MPEERTDLLTELEKLHVDAVLWKAQQLWKTAYDPDKQAEAVDAISAMLVAIKNEAKRAGYTSMLSRELTSAAKLEQDAIDQARRQLDRLEKLFDKTRVKAKPSEDEQAFLNSYELQLQEQQLQLEGLLKRRTAELPEPLLKKAVKDLLAIKKAEQEAIKTKAQFDKQIRTAMDAGLPEDFTGSKEDIFNAIMFGIYEHKGAYWCRGAKGDYEVSNFTMKIIYHVQTSDEYAFRVIAVKNRAGYECTIQMNTDDFVSLGSFKKVIARRGDFVFKGTESDLSRLQELLQRTETSSKFIDVMGWQKRHKFWAWGNGISTTEEGQLFLRTDMHGMVDYAGKKYLIPACSSMYADKDDQFTMEKKFVMSDPQPGFDFNAWGKLMKTVYGDKCIAGILHYLATVFSDIVFNHVHKFPLLNLFGPPGSGKSEMAKSLSALFGLGTNPISLEGESTPKSYLRKMAQAENAYVLLEEFKNNQVKHIGTLKNVYDRIGYDRAKMTNDNQTHQTPIRSTVILIGQEMPTSEPALFTRVILVSFDGSNRNLEAFTNLTRRQDLGLGYITASLLPYRQLVEQNFSQRLPIITSEIAKEVADSQVIDRMILNISILLTMMDLLKDRIQLPFDWKQAKRVLVENMLHQHHILAGSDNLARWWGIVELLFHTGLISEERDFRLRDGKLYIRLMQVHPLYVKEMHAQRDPNLLAKTTLEYYLKLDKGSFVEKKRQRFDDGSNNDCFVFNYAALKIDLLKAKANSMEVTTEQKEQALQRRYREMGLDEDGRPLPPSKAAPAAEPAAPIEEGQREIDFDNPPENGDTI